MPQSITSFSSTSSSSPYSRSRSSSISSTCSSASISSAYSSSSSYSLSSYGSSLRSPSESSFSTTSSSSSKYAKRTEPTSTLFSGLNFYFDKESFKSLNDKNRLISLVKDHSASISLMLSKKVHPPSDIPWLNFNLTSYYFLLFKQQTTHFIIDKPTPLLLSLADNPSVITHSLLYQINTAIKLNVQVATLDFIYASILQLTLDTLYLPLLHLTLYPFPLPSLPFLPPPLLFSALPPLFPLLTLQLQLTFTYQVQILLLTTLRVGLGCYKTW